MLIFIQKTMKITNHVDTRKTSLVKNTKAT